jgi:hypothetical protein
MLSKLKWMVGVAALALALIIPGAGLAKSNHGNRCGHGHAKHARAAGKKSSKQHGARSHSTLGTTNTASQQNQAGDDNDATEEQNEPAEDQNEAQNEANDEQNEANEQQNEANDEQNEANDDQQDGSQSGHDGGGD